MEQVTLMLLLPLFGVADGATVPKLMFEAEPAVTEQVFWMVIRTWKLAVAVAALALAAKVPKAAKEAITATLAKRGLFMFSFLQCGGPRGGFKFRVSTQN